METLHAVTKDLAHFVFVEWFGFAAPTTPILPFKSEAQKPPLPVAAPVAARAKPPQANREGQLYVTVPQALIHRSPVATFDGVVARLPYGSVVIPGEIQNRWQAVEYNAISGWILREHLGSEVANPQFISDQVYDAQASETLAVRNYIEDQFFGGALEAPLQDVEYIVYRLQKKGIIIPWSDERPRLAGTWQRLLRGRSGIHIGISPKVDAVMEVINEDDTGRLLYVDAVFPDQSVLVSEVGHSEPGVFKAQKLDKTTWVEMHPVFIEIG